MATYETRYAGTDSRGHQALRPRDIPWEGWKEIGKRIFNNVEAHNISLVAAGVALFGLLAIFPALNVAVSLYALFSSPEQIVAQLEPLEQLLPEQAFQIISNQLMDLAGTSGAALNFTLAISVLVGVWVARKGARALIEACNIAYGETEQRSFLGLLIVSFTFTVVGILGFVALALLAIFLPIALSLMPLGGVVENFLRIMRWPILALLFILVLQCVYRYAPNRRTAKWRWVSLGAVVATVLWIAASIGFTIYVQNFGNYNETYGAIGSVIVLILWFYISAFVVLMGAEINAEMEHQTEMDSTVGPDRPIGQRGARVADTRVRESDKKSP